MRNPYSLTTVPSSRALPDDLTEPEWEELGRTYGAIERGIQWVIADWARFGEAKYGQTYERAAEITGLEYQTLANYVWVGSRFEISRRRENLSFSHHAELAALDPADQDRWLDAAERERWSRNTLRAALHAERARPREIPPEVQELNQALARSVERAVEMGWGSQRAFAEDVFGSETQQGTVSRLIAGAHRPNLATVNKLVTLAGIPVTEAGLRDPDMLPAAVVQRAARSALEALDRGEIEEVRAVLRRLVGEG